MRKIIAASLFMATSSAVAQTAPPSIPKSFLNAVGGVPTNSIYGAFLDKPATLRPPTAYDDASWGNDPGDGYAGALTDSQDYGSLWNYGTAYGVPFSGQTWQMVGGGYQQADWMRVNAGMPCDNGQSAGAFGTGTQSLAATPAYCFSFYRIRAAFSGPTVTLMRPDTLATSTFNIAAGASSVDFASMDAFCGGGSCGIVKLFGQDNAGVAATADWGLASVTLATGGVGLTSGTSVIITLTTTGGTTCTGPTITAKVTAGVVQASPAPSIVSYGSCLGTAVAPNTTQSSTTGTTPATFTVTWGVPLSFVYNPANAISGFRTITQNSAAASSGTVIPIATAKYMRIGSGFSYTPSASTIIWAGNAPTSVGSRFGITTPDGLWGINFGDGNFSVIRQFGASGACLQTNRGLPIGAVKEAGSASVTVVKWNGSSSTKCWENNKYVNSAGWSSATETASGAILGSTDQTALNGPSFDALALIGFSSAIIPLDVNYERVSLVSMFGIQGQANETLETQGGSLSSGQGSNIANSMPKLATMALRYSIRNFNMAIAGKPLASGGSSTIDNFYAVGGDAQTYYQFQQQQNYVIQYVGQMDDFAYTCPSNTCSIGISPAAGKFRAQLANYVYLWRNLANGYYAINATVTGSPSGYAAGDLIQLVQPSGVTCSVPYNTSTSSTPYLTVGHATAGVPDLYSITYPGVCKGTGLTGSAAGSLPAVAAFTSTAISGTGTGATWNVVFRQQVQPKIVIGNVPLQNSRINTPDYLAVLQIHFPDVAAYVKLPQPSGGCSTPSTCTSAWSAGQGYGADGINNLFADPIIGPNTFNYSAFTSSSYSGDGSHPYDISMQYMATNLKQSIDPLLKFP